MQNATRRTAAALALTLALSASPAFALNVWSGGPGLWSNPAMWSEGLPSIADTAQIDNNSSVASTVTMDVNGNPRNLILDTGDTLTLGNTVGGNVTLTTGGFTNNGAINLGSGLISAIVAGPRATNNGTILADHSSFLRLSATSLVNNGTITAINDDGGGSANLFLNYANISGMFISGNGTLSASNNAFIDILNPITINSTGILSLDSPSELLIGAVSTLSFANVQGSGNIAAQTSGISPLTISSGDPTHPYGGVISGNVSLTKSGAGTFVVTNNSAYLGATDVTGGTLEVDNVGSFGQGGLGFGNVTIHNGGTIAGTGSVATFMFVQSGGTISPGTNGGVGVGTFTAQITLELAAGSKLNLTLANSAANSDFIRVENGEFGAAGAITKISQSTTDPMLPGHTYTFINTSGAISIPGDEYDSGSFLLDPHSVGGIITVDAADNIASFTMALPGDGNLDGIVNISDLNTLAANWQQPGNGFATGDVNGDGIINISDLNALAANWQKSVTLPGNSQPLLPALAIATPEPSSLAALASAAVLLINRRRRR